VAPGRWTKSCVGFRDVWVRWVDKKGGVWGWVMLGVGGFDCKQEQSSRRECECLQPSYRPDARRRGAQQTALHVQALALTLCGEEGLVLEQLTQHTAHSPVEVCFEAAATDGFKLLNAAQRAESFTTNSVSHNGPIRPRTHPSTHQQSTASLYCSAPSSNSGARYQSVTTRGVSGRPGGTVCLGERVCAGVDGKICIPTQRVRACCAGCPLIGLQLNLAIRFKNSHPYLLPSNQAPSLPRKPKVTKLQSALCRVKQVGELDVSVQHRFGVEERHRLQQLAHQALDLVGWGRGGRGARRDCAACQCTSAG